MGQIECSPCTKPTNEGCREDEFALVGSQAANNESQPAFSNRRVPSDMNATIGKPDFVRGASQKYDEEESVKKRTIPSQKPADVQQFAKALKQCLICSELSEEECRGVSALSRFTVYKKDDIVCQEGERGTNFFIIESGEVEVSVKGEVIKKMSKGLGFGELALIHDCPRTATVRVFSEEARLWAVARKVIQDTTRRQEEGRHEHSRLLDGVELFKSFSVDVRDKLCDAATVVKFAAKDKVCKIGDPADSLFIVKAGQFKVLEGAGGERILRVGDCFGERALLGGGRRQITVEASSMSEALSITVHKMKAALGENFSALLKKSLTLAGMQNSEVLKQLSSRQRAAIASVATFRTFTEGQSIPQDLPFLMVLTGSVSVAGKDEDVRAGFCIGDNNLLSEKVETYKLTVGPQGCEIASLATNDIQKALRFAGVLEENGRLADAIDHTKKEALIRKIPLFRHLSRHQIDNLVRSLILETRKKGFQVIVKGQPGTHFYIIEKGDVEVLIDQKKIRELHTNDYFGERALLFDEARSATVVVESSEAHMWALDKDIFMKVVRGKMEEYLKYRIQLQDVNIQQNDLETVKELGEGAFGLVKLVTHKKTGTQYALKCIETSKVNGEEGIEAINNEIKTLGEMDHPAIIRLVCTFDDPKNKYLLTELVTGGDLYGALRVIPGVLNNAQARFYTGSILLALEYVMSRGIVFRDMKPENVMLDSQGYIKLIDFGTVKKIDGDRTYTIVGTPHYMAPEVVKGKGYGFSVDIWSLGVCLYEFMNGSLPFGDELNDSLDVFREVLKRKLEFTKRCKDKSAQSLQTGMLDKLPTKRMGCGIDGLEEIKRTPFFCHDLHEGEYFDRIMGRELEPPYVPVDHKVNKQIAIEDALEEKLGMPVEESPRSCCDALKWCGQK